VVICIVFCAQCGGGGGYSSGHGSGAGGSGGAQQYDYFRIVDAADYPDTIQYAYAPSIVLKDGVYHVFFCSGGNIAPALDYVRYVKSTDGGKTWTTPVDMLHGNTELGACDPSVVNYQGYYYMFFSSAYATAPGVYQTIIQVARSTNVDGPYLTYTQRGTWEDTPSDPQTIIYPLVRVNQYPSGYGAG
jgi:beta-xylosidase